MALKLRGDTIIDEAGKTLLELTDQVVRVQNIVDNMLNSVYPVGSIYLSLNNTNPSTLFGGTWERIAQGRMLIGVKEDGNYEENNISEFGTSTNNKSFLFAPRDKGGEYKNKLELANYQYQVWSSNQANPDNDFSHMTDMLPGGYGYGTVYTTNKNVPHNNMPPYYGVYIWERIN